MEKNLEQLYEELGNSEVLSQELMSIINEKDQSELEDWIRQQGCDSSLEEAKQFIQEKTEELKAKGELTPEQLEMASGGSEAVVVTFTLTLVVSGVIAKKAC